MAAWVAAVRSKFAGFLPPTTAVSLQGELSSTCLYLIANHFSTPHTDEAAIELTLASGTAAATLLDSLPVVRSWFERAGTVLEGQARQHHLMACFFISTWY
jgi:hypothetical protein